LARILLVSANPRKKMGLASKSLPTVRSRTGPY